MNNISVNHNPQINFGRRLSAKEAVGYTKSITEGLGVLGKELDIIIHNSAAPSIAKENTGIGSLLSTSSETVLAPFLNKHRFSSIQVDPNGLRKGTDGSPYVGDTFAKNILAIPLEKLKSQKNGALLSKDTFSDIVNSRPNKISNRVDYEYVVPQYERALKESYDTFKAKSQKVAELPAEEAKGIQKMQSQFTQFKEEKGDLLKKNALYQVLSNIHSNDHWPNWTSKVDKNLFCPKKGKEGAVKARLSELEEKHTDEIDFFLFKQMLASSFTKGTNKTYAKQKLKTSGDSAVAFSSVDTWANQHLFMKDYSLGCPPDYFSKDGQAWGFAAIKPETLFKEDGSLGEGGKLLFQKYETMFEDNPGGVRIDHILGLIDPFVYKDSPTTKTAGRLFSSPDTPELAKYAKKTTKEYAQIIENIVIPAAKKAGLDSDSIICEDLGEVTEPARKVMKELNLRGIAITQFTDGSADHIYRGKNVPAKNIIMVGSHDNNSFIEFTDELFKNGDVKKHAKTLAEDTAPPSLFGIKRKLKSREIVQKPESFMAAKFTELFTSPAKKVQVFFTDFLGMGETYNKPGTSGSANWSLRIPQNFENAYHRNLQKGKGLNLPEALATAIRAKGRKFAKQNRELLSSLDNYSTILKEKELPKTS